MDISGILRTVDVHVRRFCGQMAAAPEVAEAIETVRGVGYRFRDWRMSPKSRCLCVTRRVSTGQKFTAGAWDSARSVTSTRQDSSLNVAGQSQRHFAQPIGIIGQPSTRTYAGCPILWDYRTTVDPNVCRMSIHQRYRTTFDPNVFKA